MMTIDELEEWLSRPTPAVSSSLASIKGDLLILGAGGKMGPSLATMARRAMPASRRVIAVSRFGSSQTVAALQKAGVETIAADLTDREQMNRLPDAPNVILMAGQKFGTTENPGLTWMINTIVPAMVSERFTSSRIVAFSTGCVYAYSSIEGAGSQESDPTCPPGEYASTCVGRERVLSYASQTRGTSVLLFRLNYAIDLRYGVLHDVARRVWENLPIDLTIGYVNVIWQGDANARALQCLPLTSSPPNVLNVTGRERVSIRTLAISFGELMNRQPQFIGKESATAWLSDASKSFELFGEVTVPLDQMIEATSHWIMQGGATLGKPTHYEASDGTF